MNDHTEVEVHELPKCDFCGTLAKYDAKTIMGPWANMCEVHFRLHTPQPHRLGLGIGQRLVVTE